jgi:putative methionine-R-sulfoxide reductase with GAF domain
MDTYSILDKTSTQAAPKTASASLVLPNIERKSAAAAATAVARETLCFPGEDGGKSLSEMAQRDLDATLQLLAERAQYITGASGAAIALRQGENMVCCATAGPSAPDLGAHLQIDSGLTAESVRTRQTLHCDDAENDPRVNRESCRALGIASVVVMPLVRGEEVYGVFELLAGRPHAFEERDFVALQRLAEMIQTAVEHAEAARLAEKKQLGGNQEPAIPVAAVKTEPKAIQSAAKPVGTAPRKQTSAPEAKTELKTSPNAHSASEAQPGLGTNLGLTEIAEAKLERSDEPVPIAPIEYESVRACEACGFPVSQGRRLCLDCEAVTPNMDPGGEAPELFGQLDDSNTSWVRSHVYLMAALLIAAATIAVVVWRF